MEKKAYSISKLLYSKTLDKTKFKNRFRKVVILPFLDKDVKQASSDTACD